MTTTKEWPEDAARRLLADAREAERPAADDDDVLGVIALRYGYVTRAQLRACFEEARTQGVRVSELLQKRLSPEQWSIVRGGRIREPLLGPNRRLGPFLIRAELGRGGMGIVYRAQEARAGRDVALKVMRSDTDAQLLRRLEREAAAIAGLDHPNVVRLYDTGVCDGFPYLSMELVEGISLERKLPSLDLPRRIVLLEKVARGVDYAHRHGVVHRDLKPGNIIVRADGEPTILDFGLARRAEESQITSTGQMVGTPLYMAPEQALADAGDIGPATDIHALGAILYAMLTDRPPFEGASIAETLAAIASKDPAPPRQLRPAVPAALEAICIRALEKAPAQRYPTAGAFADDLARWREGKSVSLKAIGWGARLRRRLRRRRSVVVSAALAAGAAAAVALLLVPRWMEAERSAQAERHDRRARERSLKELSALWAQAEGARQQLYQAQRDPAATRRQIGETIRKLDGYVQRHPADPHGYYVRAKARLVLDDLAAADQDLVRATSLDASFAPGWRLLASVKVRLFISSLVDPDLPEISEILVAEIKNTLERGFASPQDAWELFDLGEHEVDRVVAEALYARYVTQDVRAARSILEHALQQRESEEYYSCLAGWETEPRRQIELHNQALRVMPHFARAYVDRGTARAAIGDAAGALEDFGRAIRINPSHAVAYFNRAVTHRQRSDLPAALADASRAIELGPRTARHHALRGLIHLDRRDPDAALVDLKQAADLDPHDAAVHNHLGVALYRLKRHPESAACYSRALALDPRYAAALHNRGLAYLALSQLDAATADFEGCIALDPGFSRAHANLGRALASRGDFARAEKHLTDALALDVGLWAARCMRAVCREKTGDVPGALADAEQALTMPLDEAARAEMAALRSRLGKAPER